MGGCFEAVAEALALVRVMLEEHPGNPKGLERSLPLVAEAQSGLRAAFQRLGAAADPDQLEVFEWLKVTAARNHVYIKRFMRADEMADPAGWYDLLARIESAGASGRQSRLPDSQVERIRDRLKHVQGGAGQDDDWLALINVVDEIVGEGVPPSNRRDPRAPAARDRRAPRVRRVSGWISARSAGDRPIPGDSFSADEVAGLARAVRRSERGCAIARWHEHRADRGQSPPRGPGGFEASAGAQGSGMDETKEHQAVDAFEPLIARADVALVLLAIRWSSHAFGDVKQICDRHGKLLGATTGRVQPQPGRRPDSVAIECPAQFRLGSGGSSRTPTSAVSFRT